MSKSRGQNVCMVLLALLCLATIAFSCFVLISLKDKERDAAAHKNVHLVLDTKQVKSCSNDSPRIPELPCFAGPNEYRSREGNLGPIKCKDDYFDEEGGTSFCETSRDTFHLNADQNSVVVQKPGIYRVYGQVTFKDRSAAPVVVILRINNHNFIQCHQQNTLAAEPAGSAPYTTCTLNGERRLREGDKVALYLPEHMRTINAYHKTTFWGVVRVAE